ncbi:MAG TPA: hypothetical protein VGO61_20570 [Steroidobacteraceae bacterium]|jgi:hypothetical protein|nr:hypothetical protein [Steroidobacteraceae bacterium]
MSVLAVGVTTLLVAAAHADVTVTTTAAGKASFINVDGEGVHKIKGTRMRSDQALKGKIQTLIIDIDGRRFVDLDDKKKSAVVTPLDAIADELAKVGTGAMQATLTKTAQSRQIAGYPCTIYDVNLTLPFSPTGEMGQGMDLNMVLSGTVCLATTVPGLADYQAFYQASADSGFIFGDPRAAKSPTGAAQAKAYAALTRKMAEAGMALESHVTISATGDGPMAGMFAKLAKSDITTTVTKVEAGSLPADAFEIPAGYKVKTQK